MPIEYFPPRTPETTRPPLPNPVGTWGQMWLDALWNRSRSRYQQLSTATLTERALAAQERADEQMTIALQALEKLHGPVPGNPLDAMAWRAPLVNQARELVMDDLMGEFRRSQPE